ncbi:hypothetical protein F4811DRAFT_520172 [Daldinia bambusicola]|nr:hypothetical protein F4811DRAFT_520172 [Daldinia bambusicola]
MAVGLFGVIVALLTEVDNLGTYLIDRNRQTRMTGCTMFRNKRGAGEETFDSRASHEKVPLDWAMVTQRQRYSGL